MAQNGWIVLVVMGGVFILLAIGAIMWGRGEEKGYYNKMSSRRDVREYLEHKPDWPQWGALKIGGRIALAIGVVLIVIGIFLFLSIITVFFGKTNFVFFGFIASFAYLSGIVGYFLSYDIVSTFSSVPLTVLYPMVGTIIGCIIGVIMFISAFPKYKEYKFKQA